ncbi:MAG: J domain-containing protein, partial [Pseudomonadales bacterium]
MVFWNTLGIAATQDLEAIKKAYRKQLRLHHPEEDPEGFAKLRKAYEDAQNAARAKPHPAPERDPITPPQTLQLSSLLSDTQRLFDYKAYEDWCFAVNQCSISEQQQIASQALETLFDAPWLPATLVELLWQQLHWESLERGNEEEQRKAEYLRRWIARRDISSAAQLNTLPHFQALESCMFFHTFTRALYNFDLEYCTALLEGHATLTLPLSVQLDSLLSSCRALSLSTTLSKGLLEALCHCYSDTLDELEDDRLFQLADIASQLDSAHIVDALAQTLHQRSHHDKLCTLLYHWHRERAPELSAMFAIVARQAGWWDSSICAQLTGLDPLNVPHLAPSAAAWLDELLIYDSSTQIEISTHIDSFQGLTGSAMEHIWSALYGSWQRIEDALNTPLTIPPDQAHKESWQHLNTLLHNWLTEIEETLPKAPEIRTILKQYGTDEWFDNCPEFNEQMLAMLTPEQWQACYCRHILLTDNWFNALTDADIISYEFMSELEDRTMYPAPPAWLGRKRLYFQTHELAQAWQEQHFKGRFDWVLTYFSYGAIYPEALSAITTELTELPQALQTSPLGVFERKLNVNPTPSELAHACEQWPQQFVLGYELISQSTLYRAANSLESLLALASTGDWLAHAALCRSLLEQEHFSEAVAVWNLFHYCPGRSRVYDALSRNLYDSLRRAPEFSELEQDEFELNSTEAIYCYVKMDKSQIATPLQMEELKPEKEAKPFIYPMCYLFSLMAHGFDKQGFAEKKLAQLKGGNHSSPLHNGICQLAQTCFDHCIRQQVQHDKTNITALRPGKGKVVSLCVLLYATLTLYWPKSSPLEALQKASVEPDLSDAPLVVSVLLFIFLGIHFYNTVPRGIRTLKAITRYKRFTFFLGLMILFTSANLFILSFCLLQFSCLYFNSRTNTKHGWNPNVYEQT